MMNKKYILPVVGVFAVLTVLFAVRLTMSYLVDTETANNVITVGNVALRIDEGSFTNSSVVAAGQKLTKTPKIINTGSKDEFVFFKVGVPKKTVTLLYETDTEINNQPHKEGEKVKDTPSSYELFKMNASSLNGVTVSEIPDSRTPKEVIFKYHNGDSTGDPKHAGWIYLSSKTNNSDPNYDYYVFGYNKKLIAGSDAATNSTVTLFDEIQLKSFIDEELVSSNSNVKVDVTAYGIQSDELGYSDEYLSETNLVEIWDILERKQVGGNAGS